MFYAILAVHLILCVGLIILVLLQQGKGADMGAAFGGGGSNTLFGAGGATSMITKATTGLAVAFMITSILLVNAFSSRQSTAHSSYNPLAGSVVAGAAEESKTSSNPSASSDAASSVSSAAPVDAAPVQAVNVPAEKKAEDKTEK